ncbi:hypothetical protein A2572_02250 [Candidatus Collierbacteria bacterium RIFOXYD1_FULL_40_9]|uniref:Uncharacterized protein n=1 Tax=Candidatus Collierbacteria bacterium RIFOXYD1_FULL_40_9 TaxID=1817731 RepID=A0A1F5FNZ5_9BACT|nr:MAG: hypothetical protein A2572_02250 [Candidatus Collierbacteria bacterium RIFOXYD1_FULL_40_9]
MSDNLWSVKSGSWFIVTIIFCLATAFFGINLVKEPTWSNALVALFFFGLTTYPFRKQMKALKLELDVNTRIMELEFSSILKSTTAKLKNGRFLGFNDAEGTYFSVEGGEGYRVEGLPCGETNVLFFRFVFSDRDNDLLVVFNPDEQHSKVGVVVFVRQ